MLLGRLMYGGTVLAAQCVPDGDDAGLGFNPIPTSQNAESSQ